MTPLALASSNGTLRRALATADAEGRVVLLVGWDESKHPREPAGTDKGGEFAPALVTEEGHGKVVDNVYAGLSDSEWDDWTQHSDEINRAVIGELRVGEISSIGNKITEQDVKDFTSIGHRIQAAARSNYLVGNFAVFRGESYDTLSEAIAKYKHNALIKFERLTSTTNALRIAVEDYAGGQGFNADRAKVVLAFQQRGGLQGIQSAPLGVPSNEFILPKGAEFRVSGVRRAGRNSLVVELYQKKEPVGTKVVDKFPKPDTYGGHLGLVSYVGGLKEFSQKHDFAATAARLDALEVKSLDALRDALSESRDALVAKVRKAEDFAALATDLKRLPRFGAVQMEVRAMLDRAWDAGSRAARGEVREGKREFAFDPNQPRAPAGTGEGGQWTGKKVLPLSAESEARSHRYYGYEDGRSKGILIYLSPDKFLNLAAKDAEIEGRESYKRGFDLAKFNSEHLPYLDVDVQGKVIAHEGRGRALFAGKAGYELIPVVVSSRSPVHSQAEFPIVLKAEKGGFSLSRPEGVFLNRPQDYVKSYADSSFTPKASVRWLRATAFWVAGILGDRVLADVKGVILNGLKTGTAGSVMAEQIFDAFLPWLGDPNVIRDEEQLAPYRLETIVRTNTTTAYNHGRLTEFLDPEIIRFVKGIRYSAILDERTTPVCTFLDGGPEP